jgi:hypothetical protein
MKMRKLFATLGVVAVLPAGVLFTAATARAQDANTSSPIIVKQSAQKPVWLKVEVIKADQLTIMVREEANSMNIHTFTYSDKAREKIQSVLSDGGYQYGDKIKIRYLPGQTEALDIRGGPSKPL